MVPPEVREGILEMENQLRSLYEKALLFYGARILDGIDLDRLPDLRSRAAVAARA